MYTENIKKLQVCFRKMLYSTELTRLIKTTMIISLALFRIKLYFRNLLMKRSTCVSSSLRHKILLSKVERILVVFEFRIGINKPKLGSSISRHTLYYIWVRRAADHYVRSADKNPLRQIKCTY